MSDDYSSEQLTVAGATIHLRRVGAGQPVLFLHGLTGAATPLAFFDSLAKDRSVIIPDHPGFGQSDLPGWLVGIGDLAYFYLDFIDRLGLKQIDIIGHSLGGWIACEIAVRNTSAIRSLTLISPLGVRAKGVAFGDIFLWSPEERASNLFHNPELASQMLVDNAEPALVETHLKNNYAAARMTWQPRFHNPEMQRWLHRIKVPVQLIWGEQDKVTPPQLSEAWASALPKVRLSKIPLSGHLPHIERCAETLSVTRAFLTEVAT